MLVRGVATKAASFGSVGPSGDEARAKLAAALATLEASLAATIETGDSDAGR